MSETPAGPSITYTLIARSPSPGMGSGIRWTPSTTLWHPTSAQSEPDPPVPDAAVTCPRP